MKVQIKWAVHSEASYSKTFDFDDLPAEIKALLEEHDGEQIPYDEDLKVMLDLDTSELDLDALADYEESEYEREYDVTQRYTTSIIARSPSREELGIPNVVHLSEALDEAEDDIAERGDAYRDAKEVE